MKASGIDAHERSFRTSGVDSSGKKHILSDFDVTVPGTAEVVRMTKCTRENNDSTFYIKEEKPKERIVLHFTAGYLKGDIDTLTKPDNEVSVPFVIARDGTIYNLWSSKFWSYHLGKGSQGGNTAMSSRSVAIEISNIGRLTKKTAGLVTQYGDNDVYCSESDTRFFARVPPFRDAEYFATFTEPQYGAIIKLLRFLTARYNIPRKFLDLPQRYELVENVDQFRGITTHVNYRPTGKWDIGPAFDWDRVIAGVGV